MKAEPTKKYEDKLFAFIDVLGFADRVITKGPDSEYLPDTLRGVLVDLRTSAEEFKRQTGFDLTVTLLSDTVIASAPDNDDSSLGHFFWCLRKIVNLLLSRQFLVRGCVLKDNIYHDDQIIVGPAIVHAYRYESKVTKYPRLAIIEKLRKRCISDAGVLKYIRQAKDGPWYLHTLYHLEQYAKKVDRIGIDAADYKFMMDAHKYIAEQLIEVADQPALFEKVVWFASYFDEVVIDAYVGDRYKAEWPKRLCRR